MHQCVASCTHTRLPMHDTAHSVNACNDREVQATCWCVPVARHADIGKELLVGGGHRSRSDPACACRPQVTVAAASPAVMAQAHLHSTCAGTACSAPSVCTAVCVLFGSLSVL